MSKYQTKLSAIVADEKLNDILFPFADSSLHRFPSMRCPRRPVNVSPADDGCFNNLVEWSWRSWGRWISLLPPSTRTSTITHALSHANANAHARTISYALSRAGGRAAVLVWKYLSVQGQRYKEQGQEATLQETQKARWE